MVSARRNKKVPLSAQVRDLLGVPCSIRTVYPRRHRPRLEEVFDDGWAQRRVQELAESGIAATVEYRVGETPCVVYQATRGATAL